MGATWGDSTATWGDGSITWDGGGGAAPAAPGGRSDRHIYDEVPRRRPRQAPEDDEEAALVIAVLRHRFRL